MVGSYPLVVTIIKTMRKWGMAGEVRLKEMPKGVLKIEYEPEVNILTIYLQNPETPFSHSDEAEPGVILNYAEDGRLSSVEVLDASHHYPSGQLAAYSVDELIDLRTASGLSGIAPVTLRAQAEKGRMRALRLAGHWVTTREQLQQYIDSRSRNAMVAD